MQFTVLQWNVWTREDPRKIAEVMKKLQPDLVGAQELWADDRTTPARDTAREIAEACGYHYYYQNADTWDVRPEKTAQGNAIFSRTPLTHQRYVHVQTPKHNPPNAVNEGRVYMEATTTINGRAMTIGTAHLSYSPEFEMIEGRQREADNLVNELKSKRQAYVFTADLNSPPDGYPVAHIERYLKNAGPDYSQKSWTTRPFDYHGWTESGLAWRIDYVFATPDLKVVSAEIVKTDVSDHLPILVRFEV